MVVGNRSSLGHLKMSPLTQKFTICINIWIEEVVGINLNTAILYHTFRLKLKSLFKRGCVKFLQESLDKLEIVYKRQGEAA